jgi:hypothetical protein
MEQMEQENKYCCIGMEAKINKINQKGFSIILEENSVNLVYNAIDIDKEEILLKAFREKLIGLKLPSIGLIGKVQIKFCPYCGKQIQNKEMFTHGG